jgi:hypothetical protein
MSRSLGHIALVGVMLCVTGPLASAQTTTSTETKSFEVIAQAGNSVVVKLPEGTRELTVPETFRFTVNGQQLAVHDLKPGMNGTATITTRTQTIPVTVTEVKNGSVVMVSGPNLYVRTGGDVKMFTQSEVDRRGVSLVRDGKPAQLTDFRAGDNISATIVTTQPPRIVTDREVQAILNRPPAPAAQPAPARAAAPPPVQSAAPTTNSAASPAPPTQTGTVARALPKTAGTQPLIALVGLALLALATGLRRLRLEQ